MDQQQNRTEAKPLRPLLYNQRFVDRLRKDIQDREHRKQLLLSPRTVVMKPMLQEPQLRRDWIEKCGNCKGTKDHEVTEGLYPNEDLFCARFQDVLQMKCEASGLMNLMKTEFRRFQLSTAMTSLLVHPVCLEVLRAFRDDKNVPPVVFVIQPSKCDVNRIVVELILMLVGIPYVQFVDMNSIRPAIALILTLDKAGEEILNAADNEIILIPVTINFDRIDGQIFHDNLGRAKVNFIEPYTKLDMMRTMAEQSSGVIDHLKHDMLKKMPITCTNVLAFLLLTRFRDDGAPLESVCQAFDEIRRRHRTIEFAYKGETKDVLAYAMETLRELIIVRDDNVKASEDDEKIRALSEYSKPLARHFALESILMLSAGYLDKKFDEQVREDPDARYRIEREQLVDMARLFVEKFNDEFQIVRPCAASSKFVIETATKKMFNDGLFRSVESDNVVELDEDEQQCLRFYNHIRRDFEDSDEDEEEYEFNQKKFDSFDMRINREQMKQEIENLRKVLPAMESQLNLKNRSSVVQSIVLLAADDNMFPFDDENEDDFANGLTVKERIIETVVEDAWYLAEVLNREYYMRSDLDLFCDEAKRAFAVCIETELVIEKDIGFEFNDAKIAEIKALQDQLYPTVDAYYTVAMELRHLALAKKERMNTKKFIENCMKQLREDVEDGKANAESVSKVLMENALEYFASKLLIEITKTEIVLLHKAEDFEEKARLIGEFLR